MHRPGLIQAFRLGLWRNLTLLRTQARHPILIILKLIWPFPIELRPTTPLLSSIDLYQNIDLVRKRHDGITMLRRIPLFVWRDNPTRSIYRMYEFICSNDTDQLMLETQYFWHHPYGDSWILKDIPDPHDIDPERYAILASIVESLVLAFNCRRKLGLKREGLNIDIQETSPSWTNHVPSLPQLLVLWVPDFPMPPNNNNNPFSARNIFANAGNIFSI